MSIKILDAPEPSPGPLGRTELYTLGMGQVIGAGIITLIGYGIAYTGNSAVLAIVVAVILGLIYNLPLTLCSSAFRMGGGYPALSANLLNPVITGVTSLVGLVGLTTLATFGTSFGIYLNQLFPAISIKLGAVICFVFIYAVNMLGIKSMAKAGKYMGYILIVMLLAFVVVGLTTKMVSWDALNPGSQGFFMNGSSGFIGAVALFMYMSYGYNLVINFGVTSKDAKKDTPWTMVACGLSLILVYGGIALVNTGVMPITEAMGMPLSVAAKIVLPGVFYILFMFGGPLCAILTTLNSTFASVPPGMDMTVKDGWLPKWLVKKNRFGAQYIVLSMLFVIGIIPVLFGLEITTLTNMAMLISFVTMLIPFYCLLIMPKKCPTVWKAAKWHLPNWLYYIIWALSFAINLVFFGYFPLMNLPLPVIITVAVLFVVIGAYAIARSRKADAVVYKRLWSGLKHDEIDDIIANQGSRVSSSQ